MFSDIVIRKNNKLNFLYFLQKTLRLGNTAITFAYESDKKSF
jgi:hypothetical protein